MEVFFQGGLFFYKTRKVDLPFEIQHFRCFKIGYIFELKNELVEQQILKKKIR